jgi:hypothetical protein
MTSLKIAKIEFLNINLGQINLSNKKSYYHHTLCKSHKPTSAEVKCILYPSLINLKAVTDITVDYKNYNFKDITSDVKLNLDHEYTISDSSNRENVIQLVAEAKWFLDNKDKESFSLTSEQVKNTNSIEANIPPSSCFKLAMQETLSSYSISYDATAIVNVFQGDGEQIVGSELKTLAGTIANNNQYETTNRAIKLPVSGSVSINVIGSDSSEVMPCDYDGT